MKIAIIDSGIDKAHKRIKTCDISGFGLVKNKSGNIIFQKNSFSDNFGHGTACAAIIHKHVPWAKLISIKVFHDRLVASEIVLCKAIRWCIENEIDIVNLSLGFEVNDPPEKLASLCELAFKKNIIVVSASHNNINLVSYPAYLPTVFGVMGGSVKKHYEFGFKPNSPVEFIAKGSLQRVAWKDGKYNYTAGTSYACAHFTGIVAAKIKDYGCTNILELKANLICLANDSIRPLYIVDPKRLKFIPYFQKGELDEHYFKKLFSYQELLNDIKKIALFPISEKEMSTFGKFSDCCKVDIYKGFDFPRALNKIDDNETFPIQKDMPLEEDFGRFHTLVLGYFYDHLFEANVNYGYDLIDLSIKYNKNFYVFDERLKKEISRRLDSSCSRSEIFMPEIGNEIFDKIINLRYLPVEKAPVLAVIGTGNKQGKFTTQLRVKKILEDAGYKISLISTEPHGVFFGADFSFPIGYMGTVKLKREKWFEFLKAMKKGIDHYLKPNLFLTGIQGGLIPRGMPLGYETAALEFVFGMQPDAVICTISPEDSVELVSQVISTVKIYTKATPIFFALTPFERKYEYQKTGNFLSNHHILNHVDYEDRRKFFSKNLNAEVINIMDKTNDILILNTIQNKFS